MNGWWLAWLAVLAVPCAALFALRWHDMSAWLDTVLNDDEQLTPWDTAFTRGEPWPPPQPPRVHAGWPSETAERMPSDDTLERLEADFAAWAAEFAARHPAPDEGETT